MATQAVAPPSAKAISWTLPALDLSDAGRDALEPQVAVAPDGATTVVWSRFDGTHLIVQATTRPAGSSTFATPQSLSSPGRGAIHSQVAVAPDGTTTVIWEREYSTYTMIQAATRPAGSNTFSAPVDLSSAGLSAAVPQIAVAPDGATTVTWKRYNGANFIIQAATRPAGSNTFSAPVDLSGSGQSADSPQVAVAPDGATTVTWKRYNGANFIIQAATRPAGSNTFSAPADLSAAGRNAGGPQIAVAPDGATTVTWTRDFDGTKNYIQAATRPAGSNTFSAPADLSDTSRNAEASQVAVAPDGSTTITWTRDNGTSNIIQAATRPAGSNTFTSAVNLSEAGQQADASQIAIAPDGATTVTWARNSNVIQAATRPAGSNSFSAPVDLSSVGQDAATPQVTVAPDGATTVAWTFDNGTNYMIEAATSTPTQYSVNAQLAGDGTGTITSSPAGISCGSSCSASFNLSSRVTLTATPASGSTFGGWGGACSGTSATCTLTILGDKTATASFAKGGPGPTPPNGFTIASTKARGSYVTTSVRVPGAGRIWQRGTYRATGAGRAPTRTACTTSRTTSKAGTYTLTCRLNSAARKQRSKGALRVRVRTTFTPTGGTARSTVRTVVFRSLKPNYTG